MNQPGKSIPVWDNILLRTVLYYLVLGGVVYSLGGVHVGGFGSTDGLEVLTGAPSKKDLLTTVGAKGPAAMYTLVAMASAFLFSLPVAWIYVLTRQKKGYSQSVVQALIVLPVVIAGVVILVKYSLILAFALGGIVAAVRFRTTLDDTKDAAAIFCVTGIGLASAVEPDVAAVLSVGFNMLVVGLWATEFGRSPASLEGKRAQRQLERALTIASRTGTFVAKMDDEVLKSLAPEQLEALADRAWKRKKKIASESADTLHHEYTYLLRVPCTDPDVTRPLIEREFDSLFSKWKFMGADRSEEGCRVVEYGVDLAETVTKGVVCDVLRSVTGAGVTRVELR
ncbi:MAG: DUF4956 domain-containing protein [Gemmatimonadaceae bacterium]|nr:DUF4956 domain-containing protein [Gemmatimonadaceae bacterium]